MQSFKLMPSVAKNTLFIQEGACNPRAMARELVRAIDEACDNGGGHPGTGKSPEVRLILHQLFFVVYGSDLYLSDSVNDFPVLRDGLHGPKADWDADTAAVRAKVAEEDKSACTTSGSDSST
jgi:hypothetical protein